MLCFHICKNRFSHNAVHIVIYILVNRIKAEDGSTTSHRSKMASSSLPQSSLFPGTFIVIADRLLIIYLMMESVPDMKRKQYVSITENLTHWCLVHGNPLSLYYNTLIMRCS